MKRINLVKGFALVGAVCTGVGLCMNNQINEGVGVILAAFGSLTPFAPKEQ